MTGFPSSFCRSYSVFFSSILFHCPLFLHDPSLFTSILIVGFVFNLFSYHDYVAVVICFFVLFIIFFLQPLVRLIVNRLTIFPFIFLLFFLIRFTPLFSGLTSLLYLSIKCFSLLLSIFYLRLIGVLCFFPTDPALVSVASFPFPSPKFCS